MLPSSRRKVCRWPPPGSPSSGARADLPVALVTRRAEWHPPEPPEVLLQLGRSAQGAVRGAPVQLGKLLLHAGDDGAQRLGIEVEAGGYGNRLRGGADGRRALVAAREVGLRRPAAAGLAGGTGCRDELRTVGPVEEARRETACRRRRIGSSSTDGLRW
jgi:hypothetical protein